MTEIGRDLIAATLARMNDAERARVRDLFRVVFIDAGFAQLMDMKKGDQLKSFGIDTEALTYINQLLEGARAATPGPKQSPKRRTRMKGIHT